MPKNQSADLDDFLEFLPERERRSFESWSERNTSELGSTFLIGGIPVDVVTISGWKLRLHQTQFTIDTDTIRALNSVLQLRQDGDLNHMFLCGKALVVFHDAVTDRSTGRAAMISDQVLDAFIQAHFPSIRLTKAQRRVMACLLGGLSLSEGAETDGRSQETRKQQAQEIRQKFMVDRTEDLVRIVGAQLTRTVSAVLGGQDALNNVHFNEYCQKYLPSAVRRTVLITENGRPLRVLDMGPKDGAPMIGLHPIILPDFRTEDVEALSDIGVRLIWPLRNGQLGPADPTLSEEEQISRAIDDIRLVHSAFLLGSVPLVSFAASSKVAVRYADRFPDTISSLCFLGACVLEGRPQAGPRSLAKGLIAMLTSSPSLANTAMAFFRERVLNKKNFAKFLRRQFEASPPDTEIIERDLSDPIRQERMRFAILNSAPSLRHDFNFQRALEWRRLNTSRDKVYFFHGEEDAIHPVDLIQGLVAKNPDARLVRIAGAGQLLHHEHLKNILSQISTHSDV